MKTPAALWIAAIVLTVAMVWVVEGNVREGTPVFFAVMGTASAAYLLAVHAVARGGGPSTRALAFFVLLSMAWRVPLALVPTGPSNDVLRYVWDARVVRAGLNPYTAIPSDPALSALHTPETRRMNNIGVPSPYPPAAQAFFLLATLPGDDAATVKRVVAACDLLLIVVIWRWLAAVGLSPWWVLVYAWNPLVSFEVARSGHFDAVGVLAVVAAALALARRRTLLASVALALAIGMKFLPVVLVPLFWRRVRARDALAGGLTLAALYAPFLGAAGLPLGSVVNVVDRFRFNAPVFRAIAAIVGPRGATLAVVAGGLSLAAWMRRRLPATAPAAWAWPMAVALLGSPLVYPWYLVWLLPFCVVPATMPLIAWSVSILPVYVVWSRARAGEAWSVPAWALVVEYGIVAAAVAWDQGLWKRSRRNAATP